MQTADETQKLLEQLQAQFAAQGQQLDNESLSSLVRQLQDRDQHDWCEAAGQSEPLTTRLKNLLKDYPADVGLFKEMVQNADDAGAARVHFVWDNRKLGRGSLLSPEMATWQTNCLWAYNDALFTEQDFEAICRLGVGGKRSSSERIGRFGLGFNSVYNLTDLPSILSDSMILFLDPHVSHLRKMGASTQKPGIKLRFLKVSIIDRFRDQFMPYHKLLGCDLESSSPFKGTLIRIPFRTKESAAKSEISKIVVSDEMVAALSQQFQAEAFQWLLFLQNVQEISMSRLAADGSEPVLQTVFSVSLARAGLTKRPSIVTCGSSGRGTAVSTQLEVLCSDEKQMLRKYHLFTDTQHGFRSRVCLAVPLMQEQDAADVWCHDEDGRVFCFLPVPRNVDLGLRLHVHAPLNMAQDRRSVLLDNRIGESEQELVRHNFYLLDDLIPSALMACLQDLAVKRNQMPPAHFFALFPTLSQGSLAPSQRIAQTFYAKLLSQGAAGGACPLPIAAPASLRNRSRSEAPPQYWVKIAEAVFVPSVPSVREHVTQALLDSVVECLLRCGVPLVDAPPSVLESLMRSGQGGQGKEEGGRGKNRRANFTLLTPSWLRQRLRSEGGMKSHAINQAPAANIFAQLTPVDVTDLLEFAVSDGNIDDLSGVPLLMCEDEATVQPFLSFSQSAQPLQPVFFPQNPLERRLFPNKDGKKLLLASKFEARPMLWAKFKKLAEQAEQAEQAEAETENEKESRVKAGKASPAIPAFQCKYVTFPRLVRALQMLLPRTWNKPVPSISMNDYAEWVEDWLQAMWKWLGDKEVHLFHMVHWPLIPSLSDAGVDLVRIPEANKLVLFSGRRAQEASVPTPPPASGYPPPAVQPPQPPQPPHPASRPPHPPPPPSRPGTNRNEPVKNPANGSSGSSGMGQGKEKFLRVQKLLEAHLHCRPIFEPSWLLQHENQLRTCVHASTAEGLLKSMHFASKLISSCQKSPITPAQALHVSLSKALNPHDVGALLSIAATVQKEGCSCEKVNSRASWKSHCEVLRGLPFLCRFNKPQQHISLAGTENAEEFWILPETCPEVLGALRAAQVDLPTVEVADEVLETVTSETWAVSSLLREHLGLPKFQWSDLLLKHVFTWAHTSSGEVRQSLMRAIVYHWRDMELTGHSACLEALQQIPFISTVGGGMLSAAEALDPAIERLPALYGPGDIRGPFPDSRWQSAECRAVLQFRSHLNYQELNERLGFLHHLEVQRRESNPQQESQIPGDVLTVSNALLRYVCEVVSPLMVDSLQSDQEEKQDFDSRSLWGMLSLTGIGMEKPKSEAKTSNLAEEELMSIQSKLRRCFWLPPLSAPSGWPAEAPWKGSLCGLCSAEEVRLVSEEFLVGMVRPLIGLPVRGAGNTVRLPRRFLESIGLQEKPQEGLLKEQLCKMEEWTMSLPAAKREVHASWITRCLYDHLYPMLVHSASIQEFVSDKTKRLWVSQGGFLPLSRMSRQSIEFPPYLVKAPAEWKEKNPLLWSNIKDNFGVADYSEALQCILKAENSPQLDAPSLDIAVRLVMAITDNLQQERAENSGAAAAAGSKLNILMPTSENTLRPARDCVFNNMTWLPDVETADLNLGTYCLVHPKISHAVAHTCGCRGLSLVYAREATEMHGADWCEAAGQSEPITTRLKNLLKDYPADISMFKEMVQNADDAGATEVHFVWDWRQHRKQSLLTPDMDRWQGPSLWIFNNAQFTTKDFDSICRLGVGGKREQQRKIGRFGLGFNSVYNFTDLPSILSGDMVLFLDPHVHHLSAMGASVQKPGIKLRFLKINVLEKFRDQFEPYHGMLGCDLSSSHPFEGTLIRVPFRTPEVAKTSEVSSIQLDTAAAEVLSSRFQKEAFQWLLFLQSVAKIRLSEIREGDSRIQCLCEVKLMPQSVPTVLKDETSKEEKGKGGKGGQGEGGEGGEDAEPVEFMALELQAPRPRVSAIGSDSVADVSISTESFGSPPYQRCLSYRLVGGEDCGVSEQVCAAIPLVELPASTKHSVKLRQEEGRLFCFLPLPPSAVSLRVALHVHAPLNTTQDRRNVLLDNRVGDNEIISTNVRLLDVRIPECLARCAINLSNLATPEDFFSIFPVLQRSIGAATGQKTERKDAHPEVGVADRVAHSFYKLLIRRPEPLFPTAAGSMKKCVPFRDAVFCSKREAKLSSGGPPEQANALLDKIIASLARFGVPIVKIPLPVLESFEQVLHPVLPRTLTPAWLRQFLRNISASSIPSATPKRGFDLRDSSDDSAQKSGEGITIGSLTPEEAVAFLDFVLADNDFGDLEGVPLLFTEDMTAGTQPFTLSGTSMLFVPEGEEEYQLLPQAPRRLLSKRIRNSRPWVWQNLQRMASSEVQPSQPIQGEGPSYQLRKMTVSPLMSALQELLPKTWNVPVPEVGKSDWEGWAETWLRALWNWLSRMSVPARNMMHWPILPSLREKSETDKTQVTNASTEVGGPAATQVVARLHRLVPDSTIFSQKESEETKSSGLLEGRFGEPLVGLMQKVGCTPVWLPDWLQERESQLHGFVHPGTADGLMKACHNRLRALALQGEKEGHLGAVLKFRKLFGSLTAEQHSALAAWLVMAGRENCDCHSANGGQDPAAWRLKCEIFRTAPLFSPFARQEQVAIVDFDSHALPKGSRGSWSLLPEACPEVVATLRAAGIPMPGCVEPVGAENVAALVRELHMPRLTWAEVLLGHVFPWASKPEVEPTARQGLMLAIVQRWRQMELAGNEQCVEALQLVSFIPTVDGQMRSPATLLDPRKEDLKLLYMGDGPFPAAEVNAVLLPLMQRGLLRCRQELSLKELHERLVFLDSKHQLAANSPEEGEWDKVKSCAENFLQYAATTVSMKCQEVRTAAAAAAVPEAPSTSPSASAAKKEKAHSFFSWSSIMPLGDFLTAAGSSPEKVESLEKREEWAEDDVETLKCKFRSCRWIPAAKAPREWLAAIPWAGSAHKLWRPSDLVLMSDFWTCGAASPVLDLETQVVFSGERKPNLHGDFLELLGISSLPEIQRIHCAWAQLEAIRSWSQKHPDGKANESESAWISKCLYHYVYPLITGEAKANETVEGKSNGWQQLDEIFVAGTFVPIEDLSLSQNFGIAGLHQIPKELQATARKLCSQIRPKFQANDLARALYRLSQKNASPVPNGNPNGNQLSPGETESAVHLAMALSERIRSQGEDLPEHVMVPTSQGKLRPAEECVFNNMRWLSEEEQHKRNRAVTSSGLHWVHQSISNDVAVSLNVQALSTQVAAEALAAADDGEKDPEWFEAAGQTEPLTTRLRSLLRDISESEDLGLFKSLLQNADDAKASEVHFVWDWRSFGRQSLMSPEMGRWQGPCLWAHNNASFSPQDFENITQLGAVKSTSRKAQIGRFGLGFNSVYSLTDLPSILSDDVVLFLDPHVHHLKAMGASPAKPGIKLRFLKIDVLDKFRDQFEPYHGMFGCDLNSSTRYQGTLIRMPFRTPEAAKASEISKTLVSQESAMAFLRAFRDAAAECLVFLQHVQRIVFSWITSDAGANGTPQTFMEIKITPPGIPLSLDTPKCSNSSSSSKQVGESVAMSSVEISTDEQALEYRRLFSSRTVAQSKEKQSFISDMLNRLGMSKSHPDVRPYISFNLIVSISWSPPMELQKEFDSEPCNRKEAWRLILQHDNPEDERWAGTRNEPETSEASEASFAYVPFGGLALCLSRPLRTEEPRICCFMPLPITSSLPFLINANFCLSDPTAPGRLDLVRGSTSKPSNSKSDWNGLLLHNIIEPLICTLIHEQSAALQAFRSQKSASVAVWADRDGVCSLMPRKSQLPLSLQQLLNLPTIYASLSHSALFPVLSFETGSTGQTQFGKHTGHTQFAEFLDASGLRTAAPLVSYVDSVQPLPDDIGTVDQRQAVHEYLCHLYQSKEGKYRFCDVVPEVQQEFSSAGLKRKAYVDRSLVLSCLRQDSHHKYSCAAASKLLGFILSGEQDDSASKLQGLKLAPLCDNKVACFGDGGSDQLLFCAFVSDNSRSSFAQRVLQQLASKATLDLSGLDARSHERLRQQADKLGIRHVEKCEQLSEALLLALPSIRASPPSSSVLASLDETFAGRILGSTRQAAAGSLGFGSDEHASSTLCALWSFVQLAEDGLSDEFLSAFDGFYVVPAWNAARSGTQNSASSIDAPLMLVPLSASEPLLLPECEQNLEPLMEVAATLVSDRFVDKSHPAMTDPVLRFLQQRGIVQAFSRGSLLTVLAASAEAQFSSLISRCQRLQPDQRELLRSQLCQALCDPIGSLEDGRQQARASVVCKLPIFLAESWSDGSNLQAFRSLMQLAVVDGEPLPLRSPPVRLDLNTAFVFRVSTKTPPEVSDALGLVEVKEILAEQGKYFDMKTWLQKQILPHLESMIPDDQVIVLERLLPLLQDIEEANSEPYLVPAETHGKMMKPPFLILDPQDFTIQEIFGFHGEEDWPALDGRQRYHFPAKSLSAPVLSHLRRLGMRKSVGDGDCLAYLCQVLKDQHNMLPWKRYQELQRGLMQRIVESWRVLPAGPHRDAILQRAFVDTSRDADSTDLSDTLFELKPFTPPNELFKLSELVSRAHPLDPYLCWTTLPLCPRGFPEFEGYQRPTLKDVVAHALALGSLPDGAVPVHQWEEFKEKVVGPMCQFLAQHEVFQEATAPRSQTEGAPAQMARECAQVCSRLRKAKFIAIPLDPGSGGTGPHTLVAPWRISLVLKEHRPPMFALPDYLTEHVSVLRMLGVRDAVELPQESLVGQETDSARAADEAMTWLFENGSESFSDVTVRCDGGSLFLHRNILMSRSEYFKAMFQGAGSGFLESHSSGAEVSLMEFPLEVAQILFGYLYHGRVDERPLEGADATSNSLDLMCLADQLGVPRLFEFAQLWVANQQDLEDCSEMLKLASRHRADLLERATLSLMAANLDSPEVEHQLPNLAEDQRQKLEELIRTHRTN